MGNDTLTSIGDCGGDGVLAIDEEVVDSVGVVVGWVVDDTLPVAQPVSRATASVAKEASFRICVRQFFFMGLSLQISLS